MMKYLQSPEEIGELRHAAMTKRDLSGIWLDKRHKEVWLDVLRALPPEVLATHIAWRGSNVDYRDEDFVFRMAHQSRRLYVCGLETNVFDEDKYREITLQECVSELIVEHMNLQGEELTLAQDILSIRRELGAPLHDERLEEAISALVQSKEDEKGLLLAFLLRGLRDDDVRQVGYNLSIVYTGWMYGTSFMERNPYLYARISDQLASILEKRFNLVCLREGFIRCLGT